MFYLLDLIRLEKIISFLPFSKTLLHSQGNIAPMGLSRVESLFFGG